MENDKSGDEVASSAALSAEVQNLSKNFSQCSTESEPSSTEGSVSFFVSFWHFLAVATVEPILCQIARTGRGGFTFHFEHMIGSKMQHFELLKEGVSKNALKLVCARRPKCMVRFQLEVVGAKLQIKRTQKKYEISGSEEDLMNVKNYGKLIHNHSQRCKSEFFTLVFFF